MTFDLIRPNLLLKQSKYSRYCQSDAFSKQWSTHRNKLLELQVFWDVMPCRLAKLPTFRVLWCLHFQSQPVQ